MCAIINKNKIMSIKTTNKNDMPVTKGDLLEFKKDVALKSDLLEFKKDVALKSDLLTFKKDVALKSDLAPLKKDIEDLTIIVGNVSQKIDKRIDKVEDKMNEIDIRLSGKIDEVGSRVDEVRQRLDMKDLDYVSRNEHNRLEKRVRVLETD